LLYLVTAFFDTLPGLVVDVAPGEGNSAMSRQVQVSHPWTRQGDLVKPIAHDLLLYSSFMLIAIGDLVKPIAHYLLLYNSFMLIAIGDLVKPIAHYLLLYNSFMLIAIGDLVKPIAHDLLLYSTIVSC
jgi:hypothetical protein